MFDPENPEAAAFDLNVDSHRFHHDSRVPARHDRARARRFAINNIGRRSPAPSPASPTVARKWLDKGLAVKSG
jgi:hypothetical protein